MPGNIAIWFHRALIVLVTMMLTGPVAQAQLPNPVLTTLFPPGGQIGTSFEVRIQGSALEGATGLNCSTAGVSFAQIDGNRFRVSIDAEAPTGIHEMRVVCAAGMSSPRAFCVGTLSEQVEANSKGGSDGVAVVPLDSVINGRIEKKGDVDRFQFDAKSGDRVVLDCRAERIDSPLRAVLELYDPAGRLIAVNRGYYGIDPLIDYRVSQSGTYTVKLYDLTFTGGDAYCYRLAIDTHPRVAFTVPAVIQTGKTTRVTLFGWNLDGPNVTTAANKVAANERTANTEAAAIAAPSASEEASSIANGGPVAAEREQTLPQANGEYDQLEVEITAPKSAADANPPLFLRSQQAAIDLFAYRHPQFEDPIPIGLTDQPVVVESSANHTPAAAQPIDFPCEVSGQLIGGDERDWYSIEARRGEVLWLEAFGRRIGSPVDLDLTVLDANGTQELARFSDEMKNVGGNGFPTDHLDPSGRWVAPADGRYAIVVRNLIGGLDDDPRRGYRLSVRREEPAFHVVVVPGNPGAPSGLNVPRGGRALARVLAFRRRGMQSGIRVSAENLPAGVDCPDIWLGPGVDHAPLVISAAKSAATISGALTLSATAEQFGATITGPVRGGVTIGSAPPSGRGRMTSDVPLAVAGEVPVRLTADCDRLKYAQGSIVNIAVDIERGRNVIPTLVKLTGTGLPVTFENQTDEIPADAGRGYLCLRLPAEIPAGRYTLAVRGETTLKLQPADKSAKPVEKGATLVSNPVTFDVYPAPFSLSVALNAPRKVKRGEIIQLNYLAPRKNGFIGKIHTELFAPGGVVGIRGRGVTFVGQTETGTIQIIATDNAPIGPLKFLQLEAVGTVEDEPVFHGRCFVDLEIIE
jgi:hypothetical protein